MRPRTSTSDHLPPGTRIGDYTTIEHLEADDMGTVYLAAHVLLPRRVALKIMHAGSAWLRSLAIQVLREACLLEALSHPGIPRVFECGVLPDKRPWTAFEWIEGTTIAEHCRSAPIPVVEIVGMLRDVGDLLHHMHGRGVVHRQLIADAIVRTPERSFPYAITHWNNALTLDTKTRVEIDTRDDVFALGVIAYRALTGTMPDVVPTAEAFPAAPPELARLIDDMLAVEPVARPTSAEVKERARWLADTLEPLMQRPRWTPPHGLSDASLPVPDDGFAVRISRPRTS